MSASLALVVRRTIRATPERLFRAWTEELERWWGPKGMRCIRAEMDVRPGGSYRIGNETPDGSVVWIAGEFETVDAPRELSFSWRIEPSTRAPERVTVKFEAKGEMTEVIVVHERIESEEAKVSHRDGWAGCLDGLTAHVTPAA